MRFPKFDYMEWAKAVDRMEGVHLSCSGVPNLTAEDLGLPAGLFNIKPVSGYGNPDLRAAVGGRYGARPEEVFLTPGSSSANFVAMAALLEPGDEVVVEEPTYGVLAGLPTLFGATVKRWIRRYEEGWKPSSRDLAGLIGPRTRLVVMTNPHNPSGTALCLKELAALAQVAREGDAYLLVDEVYVDLPEPGRTGTAWGEGERVIATNSLTKSFGLGGIRVGWALAEADLVKRFSAFQDLLSVVNAEPSAELALRAFERIESILARGRSLISQNLPLVRAWVDAIPGLDWVEPTGTAFGFPRLPEGITGTVLFDRLRTEYATLLVPGAFFDGRDSHVRLGFGIGRDDLTTGLDAVAAVLGGGPAGSP